MTGRPAYASQAAVASLRSGAKLHGVILVTTQTGARIFRPATSKGASKSFDDAFCYAATVSRSNDVGANFGYALVGLFGDGTARAYTVPALKEINRLRVDSIFDVKRLSDATITPSGDVLGWTGPSEMALINIWGSGLTLSRSKDALINPDLLIPPRPTISNLAWISGTQYVTPADMDILIGGPDRPPSKRMIAQTQADQAAARQSARAGGSSAAGRSDETYWGYMQRQIQERTENLGIMGQSVDRLEDNSAGWADDVSKFVNRQKKNMVMGVVKSKFGL
ncbi:hypothetical protein LTS18_001627 [Coniosporium uncinatum]|uniref:Uncharacterized protein n=1 Tax=Coniosporium uncinatum TaxID=93489 RepID=A0ACC3DEU9_9PEZI|nr:hypothetical protein LTS18_001627 [Coniosporium uncinatum]